MLASNKTMLWYDTTLQGPPPTYPILIQLTLDGVYFHNDSQFVQIPQFDINLDTLNSMYGKNVNSRINLFFNSNSATDSNGVPILQGMANGFGKRPLSSLIQNDWRLYTHYKNSPPTPSFYLLLSARLLLHELGHNWKLSHSWGNDQCLDTHPHIWNFFQCHTNNLMDYSCNEPALTPCQLQRIYTRLIGGDLSSYVQNFGCPTTNAFFDLPDTVDISRRPISIPFIGQASWGESRYELEIFSVSGVGSTSPTNPADRFVTTRIGEVKNWNLASLYPFAGNTTYLVRLKTYYDTDTLNCTTSDVYTRYVHTLSLTNSNPTDPPQNDNRHTMERERRATTALKTATPQTIGYQMNLMPNPAQNWVNIEYDLQVTPSSKPYTLALVDALGRTAWQQSFPRHDLPPRLDLAPYLPGIYHLVLAQDQVLATERLLILHP